MDGDARVALKDVLHFDSDKSVPGMLSGHGRTTPFADEFWNVRNIYTTAGSSGRVSVAAGVALQGRALFSPALLTSATQPHDGPGVFLQVRGEPDAQAPLRVCVEFLGGRVPHRRKQDGTLSDLRRGKADSEPVAVVGVEPGRLPRPPIPVFP